MKVSVPTDFNTAEKEASFTLLPEGLDLTFQITRVKLTQSKKNEAMALFICTVCNEGDYKDARVPFNAMLEGAGWPIGMIQISHATGTSWGGLEIELDDYLDKTFEATTEQVDYEGTIRNNLKFKEAA